MHTRKTDTYIAKRYKILAIDRHLSWHLHGKTVNSAEGCVDMLISLRALKSLNSIEKIKPQDDGSYV